MTFPRTILEQWDITSEELTLIMEENPSLKGMVFGYVAEQKLKKWIAAFDDVSYFTKFDDHNRKKKGDLYIVYKDRAFDIESKSLQTATIKRDEERGLWIGKAQVDASDRRAVTFTDGSRLETTLLKKGEFDVLAVNCYAFEDEWRFVFCRNADLPTSTYRRYSPAQQQALLASLVEVTWPSALHRWRSLNGGERRRRRPLCRLARGICYTKSGSIEVWVCGSLGVWEGVSPHTPTHPSSHTFSNNNHATGFGIITARRAVRDRISTVAFELF